MTSISPCSDGIPLAGDTTRALSVDIWSDIACPWCYIGKRVLDAALRDFGRPDQVHVTWRSFELAPWSATEQAGSYVDTISSRLSMTRSATEQLLATIAERGRDKGLALNFDAARPGNTHDAHRLLHLAKVHGRQAEVKERFCRATFIDGEPMGDTDTLLRLAVEAGLPEGDVRSVLQSRAFSADVLHDIEEGTTFGVSSVPFFVINRRVRLPGPQDPSVLVRAFEVALQHADNGET